MATPHFDFAAAHERLDALAKAADGRQREDEAIVHRILQERARLAARPPPDEDTAACLDVLAFTLAGEKYALETGYVREVCQLHEITPLPGTPHFWAGVMHLHGRVLAVLDLRRLFGLPSPGLTELNRVVVMAGPEGELGILADSIDGLRSVPTAGLHLDLPTLGGVREQFLKGVTDQLLAVLDGSRLLGDASLKVNRTVDA